MTGKQNMVFWIGLIIILVNFWVTGQSTSIWQSLTGKVSTGSAAPSGPSGKCPPGYVFDPVHKVCVKKLVR